MQALDFDIQRAENDGAHEREDRTNFRRIFVPLCWCAEARVGEGFRPEETEEATSWCEVAMFLWQLSMVQQPSPLFVCRVDSLLPNVLESPLG